MLIRNGEIVNGRKIKPLRPIIYFKDKVTLINFINLYQDLFIKDDTWNESYFKLGYEITTVEIESVYKFAIMIHIWNDDWRYIKESIGIKRTIVYPKAHYGKSAYCFR